MNRRGFKNFVDFTISRELNSREGSLSVSIPHFTNFLISLLFSYVVRCWLLLFAVKKPQLDNENFSFRELAYEDISRGDTKYSVLSMSFTKVPQTLLSFSLIVYL